MYVSRELPTGHHSVVYELKGWGGYLWVRVNGPINLFTPLLVSLDTIPGGVGLVRSIILPLPTRVRSTVLLLLR